MSFVLSCLLEGNILWKRQDLIIDTERCYLRLPQLSDYQDWVLLRRKSEIFLSPWEPQTDSHFYSLAAFKARVKWSKKNFKERKVIHVLAFRREDGILLGAITLDNLKRGAAQSCSIGYWIGEPFAGNGYMSEILKALIFQAFKEFELSRIEAATLPENKASRRLLEKSGFKYEGVGQSYLQIAGRWRNHVLYSLLRDDRRGKGKSLEDD